MLIPPKTSRRGVVIVLQKSADARVAILEFAKQYDCHYALISI